MFSHVCPFGLPCKFFEFDNLNVWQHECRKTVSAAPTHGLSFLMSPMGVASIFTNLHSSTYSIDRSQLSHHEVIQAGLGKAMVCRLHSPPIREWWFDRNQTAPWVGTHSPAWLLDPAILATNLHCANKSTSLIYSVIELCCQFACALILHLHTFFYAQFSCTIFG